MKNEQIFSLESDFINVQCSEVNAYNKSHLVYQDMYAFCKKVNTTNVNNTKKRKEKYNVLILGMDSMSLSRFVQTMTRTVTFLKNNFWPGFRGYHKVKINNTLNMPIRFGTIIYLRYVNLFLFLFECVNLFCSSKYVIFYFK